MNAASRALTGATRVVAVWGHPVAHSRSPGMQNAAIAALGLDWVYAPFDVSPERLAEAVGGLRAMGFVGANCTVPLKESVGQYLDSVDPEAARIGSVNTVVRDEATGRLTGYSTDGGGIVWDLQRLGLEPAGKRVLIWGAGGSARAVADALARQGCAVTIANRTRSRADEVARLIGGAATGLAGEEYELAVRSADLLINTTTLGMTSKVAPYPPILGAPEPSLGVGDIKHDKPLRPGGGGPGEPLRPNNGGPDAAEMPPLPDGYPRAPQTVYDLVYAPSVTPLLERAGAAGCAAFNGLGMLACQGALSLALWTCRPAMEMPLDVMLSEIGAISV